MFSLFSLKSSLILFCLLMILVSPYILIRVAIDTLISAADKEEKAYREGVKPKFNLLERSFIIIGHICLLDFIGDLFD